MISAYMSLHSNVNDRECQIQSYRGMTVMVRGADTVSTMVFRVEISKKNRTIVFST